MEVTEIKAFVDQMHKSYLEMANDQLNELDSMPKDEFGLRDLHLKKAAEYVNKAAGIEKVMEFIYNN
tara:strand:+ start:480 stop:680 length:201 start_codon:yes stop_codon:yes gene_type:complete